MSLRHSSATAADLVALQGVGGLGHLGIQLAKRFGFRVAAVSRGIDNAALAKKLGADIYIDSASTEAAAESQRLGGASVVLATSRLERYVIASRRSGPNGTFIVVDASPDPIEV